MPSALTARFAILYPGDSTYETDIAYKNVIYHLCEKYHLSALESPLHEPDETEKKPHYHYIFLGSISPSKWALWRREIKNQIPFMSVHPDEHIPAELKAYALYITHDTEASKHKQQFTDEQKMVIEWSAF